MGDTTEGTWTHSPDEGGRWAITDQNNIQTKFGTWEFDADSDLSGTWMDDTGIFDGTWENYNGIEYVKYATSETAGFWFIGDSTGFFNKNSEGTGGYWEKDDGSDSGTWEYLDDDNEHTGMWSNEGGTT